MKTPLFLILLLLGGWGCRQAEGMNAPLAELTPALEVMASTRPSATPTFTHTSTPLPTTTPSSTRTPTATPTPTATAVPINVTGDPRQVILSEPAPQSGARCRVVDLLDFPIDPPDAASVGRGGGDFGVFRSRYDKYHSGEDWGGPSGRQNFGTPVYSIGHGIVMYAAPNGWGRDKGVVIIQHTLPDRSTILSFYGHLDPPSVVLTPGDCIMRGDLVGNIGRPRSSPHLHFEIRTHMPYQPGPGYWPEDPTLAGWLPPSQTIWTERISASPGVLWTRPSSTSTSQGIGLLGEATLLTLEGEQVVGRSLADGRISWRFPEDEELPVDAGLIINEGNPLILANGLGQIGAYTISETAAPEFEQLWSAEIDAAGPPLLMPLPGGGVAMAMREHLFGFGPGGERLWQIELGSRPFAWAGTDSHLILSTAGREGMTWLLDETGGRPLGTAVNGLLVGGEQPFLYDEEGIYRLDVTRAVADLVYPLPQAFGPGAIVALPDGGVLVAHTDLDDRRLLVLNEDGSLRWERSYAQILDGAQQLQVIGEEIYVISEVRQGASSELLVHHLDLDTAVLTLLFTGGTRSAQPGTWMLAPDAAHLVLKIGGGNLLVLAPDTAVERVLQINEQ